MVSGIEGLLLVVSAIIGSLVAAGLGWSESKEPFDVKKFVSSLIRGGIGGLFFAGVGYVGDAVGATVAVSWWDYVIVAFGAGGFDIMLKRGQGTISPGSTGGSSTTSTPTRFRRVISFLSH